MSPPSRKFRHGVRRKAQFRRRAIQAGTSPAGTGFGNRPRRNKNFLTILGVVTDALCFRPNLRNRTLFEKRGLELAPFGHVAHCSALAKLPPEEDFSFWPSDFMKGQKEKYLYIDANIFFVKAEWFLETGNRH